MNEKEFITAKQFLRLSQENPGTKTEKEESGNVVSNEDVLNDNEDPFEDNKDIFTDEHKENTDSNENGVSEGI